MKSEPMRQDDVTKAAAIRVAATEPEFAEPFHLAEPPALLSPLVFSSPHSGDIYPARLMEQTRLDLAGLRRLEDAYVDALFACAASVGAPLLRALAPRAYLDLNREPYELDPRMFDGALPEFANTRSLRVAAGLGVLPRVVAEASEIYREKLRVDEALHRIESLYKPYHAMLRALMDRAAEQFGASVLIDCHSMPTAPSRAQRSDKARPDIVIGDRFGASCAPAIVGVIEEGLRKLGYAVQRNKPYAGGFITEHYGVPARCRHAVQIEIARGLYMDETTLRKNERFDTLAQHLTQVMTELAHDLHAGELLDHAARARSAAE
jgi:N-formylglutamate amidohydrolase